MPYSESIWQNYMHDLMRKGDDVMRRLIFLTTLSLIICLRRPTLEDAVNDVVETYIFDFDEDIYGAKLEVELMHFLRPESKMTSREELINAVNLNKKQALEYVKNLNSAVN